MRKKNRKKYGFFKRNHILVGKTSEKIARDALMRLKRKGEIKDFGEGLDWNGVDFVIILNDDCRIPVDITSSGKYAVKKIFKGLRRGVKIPVLTTNNHDENIKGRDREIKISAAEKNLLSLIKEVKETGILWGKDKTILKNEEAKRRQTLNLE